MFQENDGVGGGQVETKSPHCRGQKHYFDGRICIEYLHSPEALCCINAAIDAEGCDAEWLQDGGFNDVQEST